MNAFEWSDLALIRDHINQNPNQGPGPAPHPARAWISALMGAAGFVLILEAAQRAADTLVFQFVVGAILLFGLQTALRRLFPAQTDAARPSPALAGVSAPILGLLQGQLELRAERIKEFPIQ